MSERAISSHSWMNRGDRNDGSEGFVPPRATACATYPERVIRSKVTLQSKLMTRRTAQEAQNHYVEKMGPDLGLQFAGLWQEVVYAYIKWGEFV